MLARNSIVLFKSVAQSLDFDASPPKINLFYDLLRSGKFPGDRFPS
jgi:hypothetical protein